MLPADLELLWTEYVAAERDRIREVSLERLDRFLSRFLEQPTAVRHNWVFELASSISDHGNSLPVRLPLFCRAILPALVDGVRDRRPGCPRWLAAFDHLMVHADTSFLPDGLRSAESLLEQAVQIDPRDDRARRRLIEEYAYSLEYSLHELPAGVLSGPNGASLEECDELLTLLASFRHHVETLGGEDQHAELLADCLFHFNAYRRYLAQGPGSGSYEAFLEKPTGG